MRLSTNKILIIFGILALGMMAIFPITIVAAQILTRQPEVDPQMTVQAMVTQTMLALTLNAPTQTPLPPTPTVVPATPTSTPLPAATAASYCDWVAFVKDVTAPDGTILPPNEVFTKTWRLKNRGTCTWTPDYMLVFTSGSKLGETTAVRLPGNVAPGQTVDVTILLTTPYIPGEYTSYWMLRNPSGTLFGTGNNANIPFYVDINVQNDDELPHGTVTGSLCYPSEFNPPMTLYFEKIGTSEKIQFSIAEAQNTYSVLLPKGSYYVYAWAPVYNLEGAYADPNTNLMIPVQVYGGQTTKFVNLCNWSPNPHGRG